MRSAKQLTFADGNSGAVLEAFYANNDIIGPAIFVADDISLYRLAPATDLSATTIVEGCEAPFEGARLVRVDWHLVSSSKEDSR